MQGRSKLELEPAELREIADRLAERITVGLARGGTEIAALPAYLPPPSRALSGRALVMDTGGTNMRAAIVELGQGRAQITGGPVRAKLPVREQGALIDGEAFFRIQAELAAQLSGAQGLAVGYCFSYPSEVLPSRDGKLIRWTKGVEIPGVEGTLVGARLGKAMGEAHLSPGPVVVLNDTVASLLGGAYAQQAVDPVRVIGLILGTGTNMAGFVDGRQLSKIHAQGPVAINFESGNYHPPHLTLHDDALDAASDNPGRQRYEKAMSGHYLPYLFQRILPEWPGWLPEAGSGPLVALATGADRGGEVARALLGRTADLVAAGLVAVAELHPQGTALGVAAEGGLFWGAPELAPRAAQRFAQLVRGGRTLEVLRVSDANLIGAACAALSP